MVRSYASHVALMLVDGVGAGACRRLPKDAQATFDLLQSMTGRDRLSKQIGVRVPEIPWRRFDEQMAAIEAHGVRVLTIQDDGYPEHLREVASAPAVLFYRGDASLLQSPGIAIVGTRAATARGAAFARTLAGSLADCGIVVVSGMARGIDSAAHIGALNRDGATIAVLGTGLDIPYPAENAGLMERIAGRGCVISEQLMGTPPLRHVFPRRNRLISGASHAVIVVEAARRSGALVTARWALEQGRDVGAVPGFPGDPRSKGTNALLKAGAFAVESVDDILEALPNLHARPVGGASSVLPPTAGFDDDEAAVLAAIGSHTTDPDLLADRLDVAVSSLQRVLVQLELRGVLSRDAAGFYFRSEAD